MKSLFPNPPKPQNLELALPKKENLDFETESCDPTNLKTYLGGKQFARHAKKEIVL